MRLLSVVGAGLMIAVSGCAAISGLGDYEDMPGAGNSALTQPGAEASSDDASPSTDLINEDDASMAVSDTGAATADGGELADVNLDAPPPCGAGSCGGCCMNGSCVGGQSVTTCGIGGDLCKDCTNMGGACSKGACTTRVVDAAPAPTCDKSKCGGCIPFYQVGCCKSDDTCGCEVSVTTDCK